MPRKRSASGFFKTHAINIYAAQKAGATWKDIGEWMGKNGFPVMLLTVSCTLAPRFREVERANQAEVDRLAQEWSQKCHIPFMKLDLPKGYEL